MDEKTGKADRRWLPVIVVVLVVIGGTFINLMAWAGHGGPRIGIEGDLVDDFVRVGGNMGFVRWSETSEVDEMEPNTLFAVVNGKLVGRFEFGSRSYRTLVSAGISDNAERVWINVNHSDGTYHVNCYPSGDIYVQKDPDVTYVDTDGDGLPDRMIDWVRKTSFDAASPMIWESLKPTPKPSDP